MVIDVVGFSGIFRSSQAFVTEATFTRWRT